MKKVVALRHVPFEDLGAFDPPLRAAGFEIASFDVGLDDWRDAAQSADVLIVLGGPISANDDATFPFLGVERALLAARIANDRPTIGVGLGAQILAQAAGARVYPNGRREIGFADLALTDAGRSSCLAPFVENPATLHWHNDTFDVPEGAALLASTALCRNQAFSLGPNIVAFQFFPEAGGPGFERWLIGHVYELAAAEIDVAALRADAIRLGPELARKAHGVMTIWLDGLRL
jgi:GMP synthase (glutamine-hydrolysing)